MTKVVRTTSVVLLGTLILFLLGFALFCSSLGLPETHALQGFAPSDASSTEKPVGLPNCPTTQDIVSVHEAQSLFPVLSTVEGDDQHAQYSTLVARRLVGCAGRLSNPDRLLRELRLTAYIRTHYSREERKTLFLNRMYFGDQLVGVTDAAQFYFHRPVSQLDTAQAALLLGLVHQPNYFSPTKHADRALDRRNDVLDQMVANGTLSAAQAATEKQKGLLE